MPLLDDLLADGGFPAPVRHAVATLAPGEATSTQARAIPELSGHPHLVLAAPTGSGKTLVAAAAVASALGGGASAPGRPRALVLCPTRELTDQVAGVLSSVLEGIGARTLSFTGAPSPRRDMLALARPVDCLVATPGRVLELLRSRRIALSDVIHLVLDEADMLLGPRFEGQTQAIVESMGRAREGLSVLAMTATATPETLGAFAARFARAPHLVACDGEGPSLPGGGAPRRIDLVVANGERETSEAIAELCAASPSSMVFVPRREDVAGTLDGLRDRGVAAEGFTGRSAPSTRAAAMDALRGGHTSALVSTDVTGRGIDIADLALVVHVGVPHAAEDITHRSGRTGRGTSAAGLVVALVPDERRSGFVAMAERAGLEVRDEVPVPELASRLRADARHRDRRAPVSAASGPPGAREGRRGRDSGDRKPRRDGGDGRSSREGRDTRGTGDSRDTRETRDARDERTRRDTPIARGRADERAERAGGARRAARGRLRHRR